jgi:hypothetical protein
LRKEKRRYQTDIGAGEVGIVLWWELAGAVAAVVAAVVAVRAFAGFSAGHDSAGVNLLSSGFE